MLVFGSNRVDGETYGGVALPRVGVGEDDQPIAGGGAGRRLRQVLEVVLAKRAREGEGIVPRPHRDESFVHVRVAHVA